MVNGTVIEFHNGKDWKLTNENWIQIRDDRGEKISEIIPCEGIVLSVQTIKVS